MNVLSLTDTDTDALVDGHVNTRVYPRIRVPPLSMERVREQ